MAIDKHKHAFQLTIFSGNTYCNLILIIRRETCFRCMYSFTYAINWLVSGYFSINVLHSIIETNIYFGSCYYCTCTPIFHSWWSDLLHLEGYNIWI